MKGKTEGAVEKIDAILEGHFAALPPAERKRSEQAFIKTAKKVETRARRRERPGSADRPAEARRHA
jgi:hypothetical protein